ncbi:MAG: DUF4124 domain-containing protein [Burkholderiales bacterium]
MAMAAEANGTGVVKWVDQDGQVHYSDRPPLGSDAKRVQVHPNIIETGSNKAGSIKVGSIKTGSIETDALHTDAALARPPRAASFRYRQLARPLHIDSKTGNVAPVRADIKAYVDACRRNRGVDCVWEAHAMIDGPATVLFPGDPLIFPRPDVKPAPPGLPLKYGIAPLPASAH